MTYTTLIQAIGNNDNDTINQCLQSAAVQTELAKDKNLLEALRLSAKKGHIEAFKNLMQFELAKKVLAEEGLEVLKQAVAYNQPNMLEYLLQWDAMQTLIANDDNILLIRAASSGHITIVDRLLKYKAVCDAITVNDHCALREAILKGRQAVIYRLVLTYQRLRLELPSLTVPMSEFVEFDLLEYANTYKQALDTQSEQFTETVSFFKTFMSPYIPPLPLRELSADYMEPPPPYLTKKLSLG